MKIIYISLILVLSTATLKNLDQTKSVKNIPSIREIDGVLQCISDSDTVLKINKAKDFCGDQTSQNKQCYNAYYNFKLCLIINDCQNQLDQEEISQDCWNCWADMLTDNQLLIDYQQKIHHCWEKYVSVYVGLIMALLLIVIG